MGGVHPSLFEWVGGWVGGWVEENEAVGMRCGGLLVWVDGRERPSSFFFMHGWVGGGGGLYLAGRGGKLGLL